MEFYFQMTYIQAHKSAKAILEVSEAARVNIITAVRLCHFVMVDYNNVTLEQRSCSKENSVAPPSTAVFQAFGTGLLIT